MAREWGLVRIKDIVDVTDFVANGSFKSLRENVEYRSQPDHAVLVRLVDHNASWTGDFVYVSKQSYDFLRKSSLTPGDIVIANVGANAGTVFRVPDLGKPTTLGPNAVVCKPRCEQNLSRRYLYYYLVSADGQSSLRSILSGSAQPKFNKTDLRSLEIPVPPLSTQNVIGHILGTLDDKIELNRRMSETLEAMARALFKSWFLDFDPVRVKAEGRDTGLPIEMGDMFPERFVDSELGEIPEGWEVTPFAETVDIFGGGTPKTSVAEYWNGDIPWFSVVDAPPASEVWVIDTVKKVTRSGIDNSATEVLPVGTTIISARGTVGRVALVGTPMAMNQSCYGLQSRTASHGFFTYFSTLGIVSRLRQHSHGSVFDTITRDTLQGVLVTAPPKALVGAFEKRVGHLLMRIRTALVENRALVSIRDALLPKLISGELLVRDRERHSLESVPDATAHIP